MNRIRINERILDLDQVHDVEYAPEKNNGKPYLYFHYGPSYAALSFYNEEAKLWWVAFSDYAEDKTVESRLEVAEWEKRAAR